MISSERKRCVLVVEDNEALRILISRYLEKNGFIVYSAADGASAFRIMMEHKPDIALIDVMLPDINGFEICRWIKEERQFKEVEIIFITGQTGLQDRLVGYLAGARRYLCKPFLMEDMLEQVLYLSAAPDSRREGEVGLNPKIYTGQSL